MGVGGVRVVRDEKKRTHLLWRLNERLCLEKFWSSFYNADEPYLALEELQWFNSYCLTQLSHLLCDRVSLHPKLSKSCARTGGRGTIPLVVLLHLLCTSQVSHAVPSFLVFYLAALCCMGIELGIIDPELTHSHFTCVL